jgi:membrane protein implicated in regulation of membrane protease activity
MAAQPSEWTVPAPLRALLWWPPVAFVVAMVAPEAAAGTIALAGAALAVLGVLLSVVGRAVARRLVGSAEDPSPAVPEIVPVAAEQTAA